MDIRVRCPACGKSFMVPARFAGRQGECSVCGKVLAIPTSNAAPKKPVPPLAVAPTQEMPAFNPDADSRRDEFDDSSEPGIQLQGRRRSEASPLDESSELLAIDVDSQADIPEAVFDRPAHASFDTDDDSDAGQPLDPHNLAALLADDDDDDGREPRDISPKRSRRESERQPRKKPARRQPAKRPPHHEEPLDDDLEFLDEPPPSREVGRLAGSFDEEPAFEVQVFDDDDDFAAAGQNLPSEVDDETDADPAVTDPTRGRVLGRRGFQSAKSAAEIGTAGATESPMAEHEPSRSRLSRRRSAAADDHEAAPSGGRGGDWKNPRVLVGAGVAIVLVIAAVAVNLPPRQMVIESTMSPPAPSSSTSPDSQSQPDGHRLDPANGDSASGQPSEIPQLPASPAGF